MKKIITSFILFLIVFNAFGQEEQKEPKNEIKLKERIIALRIFCGFTKASSFEY
mgnify:CR=1 FL=1